MHSLGSISAIASEKKIFLYFPIWSCVNTMTCAAQEWSLEGPLQNLGFLCRSEIQYGHYRRTYINIGPYGKMFKCLLLRNYKSDWIQTRQECSLDSPLQTLGFLFRYKMEDEHFPIGSNVNLFPTVAVILDFQSA
jgi:hypothetical protein